MKISNQVLVETLPISATKKWEVEKFQPKFESPFKIVRVSRGNVIIWKQDYAVTVHIDERRGLQIQLDNGERVKTPLNVIYRWQNPSTATMSKISPSDVHMSNVTTPTTFIADDPSNKGEHR
ncbi:hypothetical protein NPIL_524721 [Nephila pilipes]|uniref:Uncharacterized protein n=1 Tax=Nephila pilipes TaxID=299642 RepID=A0A8X6TZR7_NEPPI|nr:hypothetical protein NPIL_524721 [Nephila pilipes]